MFLATIFQLCTVICMCRSIIKPVAIAQVAGPTAVLDPLEAIASLVPRVDGESGRPPTRDLV